MKRRLHRLEDIETQEVSLVDRAANKRKFLIVKRARGSRMGPEVKKDKDGNLITTPATIRIKPQWKSEIESWAAETLERVSGVIGMIKGAVETEEEIDFPTEIRDEVVSIAEAISNAMTSFGIVKADDQPGSGPEGDDKDPGDSDPEDVTKAHWMSTLQDLFTDLRQVIEDGKKRAPQDAPNKAGPNAGSGQQPDASVAVSAEQAFANIPGLKDLMKSIQDLKDSVDGVRGSVEKQAEKIADLESGIGSPASRGPESSPIKKDADEVSWPRDMAAPKREY